MRIEREGTGCALPNYFLIGAPKAGTTSLFRYIISHPKIYKNRIKETHFFYKDTMYAKGVQWYADRYFAGSASYPVRGEATPEYLRSGSVVAPRMREVLDASELKFIVIFRDPVQRAWSNYLHLRSQRVEPLTFRDALEREGERRAENPTTFAAYFQQGLYAQHLGVWLKHFDRNQFLYVFFDDLVSDPAGVVAKVHTFLGLSPHIDPSVLSTKENETGEPRSEWLTTATLNPPKLAKQAFRRLVPLEWQHEVRRVVNRGLIRPYSQGKPSLPVNVESALRARYVREIEDLEKLVRRDLGRWKWGV